MIGASEPTRGEVSALRRVERAVRDFCRRYDEQPRWLWAPATTRMREEVGKLLAELDAARQGREPVAEWRPPPGQEEAGSTAGRDEPSLPGGED